MTNTEKFTGYETYKSDISIEDGFLTVRWINKNNSVAYRAKVDMNEIEQLMASEEYEKFGCNGYKTIKFGAIENGCKVKVSFEVSDRERNKHLVLRARPVSFGRTFTNCPTTIDLGVIIN